jgi:hypothetical protein
MEGEEATDSKMVQTNLEINEVIDGFTNMMSVSPSG